MADIIRNPIELREKFLILGFLSDGTVQEELWIVNILLIKRNFVKFLASIPNIYVT